MRNSTQKTKFMGITRRGYYIGVEFAEDDPQAKKPFLGPNIWPQPDLLPGWRDTMEEFHRQALEVAKAVARLIALALDLDAHFFDRQKSLARLWQHCAYCTIVVEFPTSEVLEPFMNRCRRWGFI